MSSNRANIAILGAGITGLAAAYFLKDKYSVRLIEASSMPGGVIKSHIAKSYLLEEGPDCFMNQKPWGLELALELGLQSEIIESQNFQRRVLVLRGGKFEVSDHEDNAVKEFLGNRARSGVNPNAFLSFRNGMQTWPNALAEKLQDSLMLNTRVTHIDWPRKQITCDTGYELQADKIILALPAYESAKLLKTSWPHFKITQTNCVYLAYKREDIEHPLDAFGLIIPAAENRKISALTFVSSKFSHRCPSDQALFRAFLKGPQQGAREEIENLFRPTKKPLFEQAFNLEYADPKYAPDHEMRVQELEASLPAGVWIAGSPYRGVGIADCVYQARIIAEKIQSS